MSNRVKKPASLSLISSLALLAMLVLQACGGSPSTGSASGGSGPITLTVAYQQFGSPPYQDQIWWTKVKQQVEASNPNIKIKLLPIVADEGAYYTKLDLMMRSNSAPDIVREDS